MATNRTPSYKHSAKPAAFAAHLIAISVAIIVFFWLLHFREGLAFKSSNKRKILNLHPLFMIAALLLIGEAIMAYKTVPGKMREQKRMHLILHLIALLAGVLGTYAIFKYKNEDESKNFVTLHTWLGIITISAFCLQFMFGFVTFLHPGVAMPRKETLQVWHIVLGMVVFLSAIGTTETGLPLFSIAQDEGFLVNFIGLLIFLFGLAVSLGRILQRDPSSVALFDDIGSVITEIVDGELELQFD